MTNYVIESDWQLLSMTGNLFEIAIFVSFLIRFLPNDRI